MLAKDWPGMLLLKMYKNPDELEGKATGAPFTFHQFMF